jgi:hypothetical protein
MQRIEIPDQIGPYREVAISNGEDLGERIARLDLAVLLALHRH